MKKKLSHNKVSNPFSSTKKLVKFNSYLSLNRLNSRDDISFRNIRIKKKDSDISNVTKRKPDENDVIENKNNYSEFELDDLEYSVAIEYDKRTFLNLYICFIKREHLVVFTFFYCKDFNLISIKLSLFVYSICLDLTTNLLFFNDDSMHKIALDYGEYNFISQIPQIIYSTIISQAMDMFIKYLSLSEKEIYLIKQYNNTKEAIDGKNKILKCLKIKFIIFFCLCFVYMIFFLYFISIFCAIYENTQVILFKDFAYSLLLSFLYPFLLYLFPAILRIISLRSKKKD